MDFAVAQVKRGDTVNAISPGWIEHGVLNTLPHQAHDLLWNRNASRSRRTGSTGTPAVRGKVVSSLCSEAAAWITGQVMYADGGATLMNPEVPSEIQLA